MRRLPPLNALPAFEATARLGSVSQAAMELGRTHGAISKQLRVLAEALGYSLFEREGTGLVLTAQGGAFLAEVAPALDALAEAFDAARASAPKSVLRLGISATFASRWLMPRLPRFHALHPGIEIEFRMAGRVPSSVSEFDLTVTWDRLRFPTSTWPFEPVGDAAFAMVHAPGYAMARDGLACHVGTRIVPDTLPRLWDIWAGLSGTSVKAERDFQVPQTGLIIDAAASGMGVAILEKRLIEAELQDGRLVAPLGWIVIENGFGAFLPVASSRDKPEVRAFLQWLRAVD